MSEQRRRYLVTSALPYANGPLHVGQISGAYLPADAFVRYLRARGEDVVYACGTDEHGVPITLTAEREGKDPQDVVDFRSEEHTSELQSHSDLVCRLLLEKKKNKKNKLLSQKKKNKHIYIT